VNQDAAAFRELLSGGGRTTVPCLRIQRGEETEWMFESADIMRYLTAQYGV
jgi:glutathione S-transferase